MKKSLLTIDLPKTDTMKEVYNLRNSSLVKWLAGLVMAMIFIVAGAGQAKAQCSPEIPSVPPTITCPSSVTVSNDAGLCSAVVTYTVSATDNCPGIITLTLVSGQGSGSPFSVTGSPHTEVWMATDASGNTATCSFTITVTDDEDPAISCPSNITVAAGPGCAATVTYSTPVGTDNCPGPTTSLTAGQASGTSFSVGTTSQVYEVTDAAGATATCGFDVTVEETTPPTITCPSNITVSNDGGACDAVVTYTSPSYSDNCAGGGVAHTSGGVSGATFSVGTTTVIWTATDAASNTSTCSFTITVNDTEPPDANCPSNITVNAATGTCAATVTYTVTASDNCAATASFTSGVGSGGSFSVGGSPHTEVWTATDAAGNTGTCSFTITVVDVEAPTISCPSSMTVSTDAGVCDAAVTYSVTTTDNCGSTTSLTSGLGSGGTFSVTGSPHTEVWTATDAAGNTATCSFTITVEDNEAPVYTVCPSNIVVSNDPGVCEAAVTYASPTVTENCLAIGPITNSLTTGPGSGATTTVAGSPQTVVWTATDGSGNTSTCTFTITVNDTELPTFSTPCPGNIAVTTDAGVCNAVVTYTAPVGADNCTPTTTQISGQASATNFPKGVTINTFRVSDAAGNTITCSFTITVTDNEDPTISCPSDITVSNTPTVCEATVTYTTPTTADNCPGESGAHVSGGTSGSTFSVGSHTVTWMATDAAGNTGTCSFTITVDDNEAPSLTCPNISVSTDAGSCDAVVTYSVTVTDNCGATTSMLSGSGSGATFSVAGSPHTEVWDATDAAGNTATCSFTITVSDNEDPTITCPTPISVSAATGTCAATVTYSVTTSDNCGSTTSLTSGLGSGNSFSVSGSPHTEVYTATDAAGNTATCSFTVTVTDDEAPTITCPSPITVSAATGTCAATVTYSVTTTDNCGSTTSLTSGLGSGGGFYVVGSPHTEVWTATDAAGNTATCSFTITVEDNEAPVAVCPSNIVVSAATGLCAATVTYTVTATDNCAATASFTSGVGSGNSFSVSGSPHTEVWTATDAAGNTGTCSFTVTVNDIEPPSLICSPNITVNAASGTCAATVTYSDIASSYSDNCPGGSASHTSGGTSGSSFGVGINTVVWTATDAASNTSSCSFLITVLDVEPPTISCPSNITVNNAAGTCAASVTYTTPTTSDNCPGESAAHTSGGTSGSSFSVGTTIVIWTATDASGNTATCSFTITVVDNEAPTISCPSNIAVNNDPGLCAATVTYTSPTGSDNCPGVSVAHTSGGVSGASFAVGLNTVIWTATDAAGNTGTCSFTITVTDVTPPAITCPGNMTVNNDPGFCTAVVTYTIGYTDNCPGGGTALTSGVGSPGVFPVGGPFTEVWTATDAAGNTNSCSFTITVVDNENPVLTCPDITVSAPPTLCSAVVTYGTPAATDNCPGVGTPYQTGGSPSGSTFLVSGSPYAITWAVVDAAGNTGTCSFNITVVDDEDPIILCPSNISVVAPSGTCQATVTYNTPPASDNCLSVTVAQVSGLGSGATYTVAGSPHTEVWMATDGGGNTSTCSFTITVVDDIPPIVNCPANINVNAPTGTCSAVVTYNPPTSSDNCPGTFVSLLTGLGSGSTFTVPSSPYTEVWEASDASGNTATCSFTITVSDVEPPTITCPSSITVNTASGTCAATVTYTTPTTTDNCPGETAAHVSGGTSGSSFSKGTTIVIWMATDASGNTATCSFTITVEDNEPPVATCPSNMTVNSDLGICGAVVTYTVGYSDNCPGGSVALTSGLGSGATFFVTAGTYTEVWTATDAAGNTSTCSFTIDVVDIEPPTTVCTNGVNYTSADGTGDCTYTGPGGGFATISDNCPTSLTIKFDWSGPDAGTTSGTVPPGSWTVAKTWSVGVYTITATTTDAAGNTSSCTFTNTVIDDEAPSLTCPADIEVNNDPGLCSAVVTYSAPSASDNCPSVGSPSLQSGLGSGGTFSVGGSPHTEVWVVADAAGNTGTCSFKIGVGDNEPPTITCPGNIAVSNDAGVCSAVVTYTVTTTDNCGSTVSLTSGLGSGGTFSVSGSPHTEVWTATDAAGNTATCSFTVTVTDEEPPVITCPSSFNVIVPTGSCDDVVIYNVPAVSDNCPGVGAPSLISGLGSGGTFDVPGSPHTEVWIVSDASGNTATCSFTITMLDLEDPVITCPPSITVVAPAATCAATVTYSTPTVTDNCPSPSVGLTSGLGSGGTFPVGVNTEVWTATDASGNSSSCSLTITVVDTEDPVITCPSSITVNADPSICGAIVTYSVTATDNCPGVTTSLVSGIASGGTFSVAGTPHTVVWVATDGGGNTATCSFTVSVIETAGPVFLNCPADIIVEVPYPPYVCAEVVTWSIPTAVDNCPGPVSVVQTAGGLPGTLFPVGTSYIAYVATDILGNTTLCDFYVTVLDTVRPVITGCPADITVNNDAGLCTSTTATWTAPTPSDNCYVDSWTNNYNSGDPFPVGTTTVWYLASDSTGNTTICTFDVTVIDVETPIINCPASVTVNNDPGVCNAYVTLAPLTWTDNCPATVTVTNDYNAGGANASDTYPVGTTAVTFTVNDGTNSTSCSITVTVVDNELPTITCVSGSEVSSADGTGDCAYSTYFGQGGTGTFTFADNCPFGVNNLYWEFYLDGVFQFSGSTTLSAGSYYFAYVYPVGVNRHDLVVTDAAGNTSSCSYTNIITDDEAPTISCPSPIVVSNDAGLCSAVVNYTVTTTDNCGSTASLVSGLGSGATYPVGGPYTEVWMATDAAGNTATCSFTITVLDTESPVFTSCPSSVTVGNDPGTCAAIVTWSTPPATDNCAVVVGPVQVAGPPSGTAFPVGSTTTISYMAVDAAGNSTYCSWTIHVDDTEPPVITCPASITVNNDLGICGALVTYTTPTGTDNCPGALTVQTGGLPSGSVFPVGTTVNSFLVMDFEGNTATCSFSVTVIDAEAPSMTCVSGFLYTSADGTGDCTYTGPGFGTSGYFSFTDNCPGALSTSWSWTGPDAGSASGTLSQSINWYLTKTWSVGVYTISVTVTDAAGNSSSCSYTNTVIDDEDPVITCPSNMTVSHDPNTCTAVVSYTVSASDNCGSTTSLVSGLGSGGTFSIAGSPHTEVWMATDAAGNTATCGFDITVIDNVGPALNCPSDIVLPVLNDSVCFNVVGWIFPTAFDCSGPVGILQTAGPNPPAVFPIGTTAIAYVATDGLGNTSSCGFNVTIYDSFPPIQNNCPADMVVAYNPAICAAIVTWTPPIAWDNCAGVTNVSNYNPGDTFAVGTTTVVYVATDPSGLTDTCTFDITVIDNLPPTITCPSNITVNNDATLCSAVVTYSVTFSDNCGATMAQVSGRPSGAIYPVGTTTNVWMATDTSGNTATCSFTITVVDSEAPEIECPLDMTVSNDAGNCSAVVTYNLAVSDNCPGETVAQTAGIASGGTFPLGTTTNTFVVTDAAGNTASCSFDITVLDTEDPVVICPNNLTVNSATGLCGNNIIGLQPISLTDNCPGVTVVNDYNGTADASDYYPVGVTTVTYTATDAAGNTSTCVFTVTVLDVEDPTIACPANLTVNNDAGLCSAVVSYTVTTADNCPGEWMWQTTGLPSGSAFPVGTTTNTFMVSDSAGNTASCSFTITVVDAESPWVTCPSNIVTGNDVGFCGAVVGYNVAYGDNCPGAVLVQTAGLPSGSFFPVGTTTNSFLVTDAVGLTASCSFTVTVNDTENPTITCPANITVNNDPGVCSAVVTFNITTTDNCPGEWFWQTAGLASGSAFPVGTTYNQFVVRDSAGNTAACGFTVTVIDNEAPQIFCVNQTYNNDPDKCYTTAAYVAPNIFDNCPGEYLTHLFGPYPGDTLPVGVYTAGFMVTDHVGLTASCQFTITVVDNEPPTTTCPPSMAVPNDPGICGAVVTFLPPAAADNCPGAYVTQTAGLGYGSGSTFPVGSTYMEYVITDAGGLSITCGFTITVYDNEDPVISNCPSNITVNNDAGLCGATVTWAAPTAVDNCAVISLTPSIASGSFFPVGTTTVVYTALDAAGNAATCSFEVTVVDNEAPSIVCASNVVVSNDPGNCSAVVFYNNPITSDNCPGETWVQTTGLSSGSAFPVGVTTNTFVVTDASGNTASCSMTVTVLDTELPVITCYGNIQVNNDPGICGAVITYPTPTATDNCPGVVVSLTGGLASGATFPVGTTTVTYTATDASGNSVSCSFLVTVIDNTPPTISCPSDMTVGNTTGMCGAIVTYTVGNADNCPGQTVIQTHGIASGGTFPLGTTYNQFVVIDASGNGATCSFNITVVDTESPQITCPANMTVNNDAGYCGAIVNYNTPVGTDNCPNAVTILTAGFNSGSFFPVGTTTVSYLVTDHVGLTAVCSFTITVVDNENPTITCPANIVVSNDAGLCSAVVNWSAPATGDNCGVQSVVGSHASGSTFPVGTTTVTYTVTDLAGNSTSCSFTVTVNDTEAPQISCPNNIIVTNDPGFCSAVVQYAAPVGTDNCPGAITVQTAGLASGSAFPVGVTTNTFVVTDASGNTAACSFTVTVLDTELPSITCPSNMVVSNDAGFCSAVVSYSISTSDNCPGETWVQTGGIASGGTFPVGTTTNTFVVTDASGNTSDCSFTITVNDTENPVIAGCPANIVVGNDLGVCGAVVTWTPPTSTDNCPGDTISQTSGMASGSTFPVGTSTVIYTAVDAAGNATQCVFTITVLDVEDPQIVCNANMTVSNDTGYCDAYVNISVPVHSDNCPGVSIVNSYNGTGDASDVYPVGTTTVVWTVTDVAGNNVTCSFDVTVEDTEHPQITCPSNITVNNDSLLCGAVVTYTPPVGSDNCGLVPVFMTHSNSQAVVPGSVSCNYGGGVHAENSYLRVFDLNSFGVPAFDVTSIDIGIENANDGTGSQPGTINLYTLSGTLNYANMTLIATQAVTVANQTQTILNIPIAASVPSGAQLVVEFMVPDALAAGSLFWIGSNSSGQTGPSYLAAPACGITQPLDLALIGFPNMHIVMNVNGTYGTPPVTSLASGLGSGATFPVGTSTEVWMVVDASGNSTTCSFDITVIDNEAPVITNCPSSITLGNDAGNCSAVALWGAPTVNDNCAVDTVFSSHTVGSAFPVGTTTVIYTAIDIYGNSTTCGFDITVLDIEKPVIANCPADISTCDPVVFWTAPTASDNCGVVSWTSTDTSGSTFPVGITTVVYTATDAAGNVETCMFTITVHPLPVADAGSDQTICFGTSTTIGGFPTGNAGTPPYTYSWAPAAGLSSTTAANPTASPAATTTYTVTVTDINGCTDTDEVTVTVDPLPTVDAGSNTAICIGDATTIGGSPTASGTVAPYTYAWAPTTGLTNPASANPTASPSATTTYTVTVTDANGCMNSATVTVTVNPLPNATITPAGPFCLNDPATTLTAATAGGTWAGTGITNATAGTFDPGVAGVGTHTITYTVTDANGCTNSASTIITVYGLPGANILPAGPFCVNGSQVYLTGVPTINPHVWAGPGIVNTANGLFDPSVAGVGTHTISYTVTNANGCTETATTTIVVNAAPNAGITAAGPFCEDEPAVNLTAATAGGTWSGPGITHAQLGTFYPYAAGAGVHTINYIVTNANGCTSIGSTTIVVNELPEVTALVTDVKCVGGNDGALNITISGGVGPYTYNWSNGATSEDITGLTAGNYSVTVTDQNGCSGVGSFTVGTMSSAITATAIITAATTPQHTNGAIDLTVSGGTLPYSFSWSNGAGTEDITGLAPGTYDVTITDANGCSYIFSYVVPSRFGTGIDPNDLSQHILLYPNPTSDVINIEIEATGIDSDMYVTIYDVLGRKVYERADHLNNKYTLQVSMRNWAAGHYMIMFNIGDEVVTKKVILTE